MKKILTIITIISILTLSFTSFVFAADKYETPQWFKDMISWRKDQINNAVEDGNLTKEQANIWNNHMDSMEKWHSENGIAYNNMGFRGCHGGFDRKASFRSGFNPSMMNRSWQNQ